MVIRAQTLCANAHPPAKRCANAALQACRRRWRWGRKRCTATLVRVLAQTVASRCGWWGRGGGGGGTGAASRYCVASHCCVWGVGGGGQACASALCPQPPPPRPPHQRHAPTNASVMPPLFPYALTWTPHPYGWYSHTSVPAWERSDLTSVSE